MNESNFKLLGNFASVDFYLCEGKDITLISENNAYNMKFLVQEALNLYVPNALVIIDLNNFYVAEVPIDHDRTLIMIPHINTTNIPLNYQEITKFITNINSLSKLAYQLMTNRKSPQWEICIKKVPNSPQRVKFSNNNEMKANFENEQLLFRAIKNFDFNRFNDSLNTSTLTNRMGTTFEKNKYLRGEKDVLIRFVTLLVDSVIKSGQVTLAVAIKLQDDILGTIEFKKDPPPFTIWMKSIAIDCFKRLKQIKSETALSLPEKIALYIQNHINQKLTLTILAQKLGCSKSSLAHLFREKYNVTIISYINSYKIDAAKYMLINSQINISQIAYTLAFDNPNYFMTLFKKYTGMTPMRYRKTHE